MTGAESSQSISSVLLLTRLEFPQLLSLLLKILEILGESAAELLDMTKQSLESLESLAFGFVGLVHDRLWVEQLFGVLVWIP